MTDARLSPADWPTLAARIAAWLPAARWFGGKGSAPSAVTIHDAVPLPGGLALVLVDVAGPAGTSPSRWVVPVDPASGADAAADGRFASWVVAAACGGRAFPGEHGRLVGAAITDGPAFAGACRASPLGGDASNTSLLVVPTDAAAGHGGMVLKLLRRATAGENPEVEVGRFLAESTRWRGTPRLLAFLRYEPDGDDRPAEAPSTIATLHAFAPGCDGAWERGLALAAAAEGSVTAALTPLAGKLGRVTAEMHEALASRPDIPAFAPRAATRAGREALAERLRARAEGVFARLGRAGLPPETASRVGRLTGARAAVVRVLSAVARAGTTAADIRVHGDYHLGQVLVDASGSTLLPIDFEGEPARPLAERREPSSAAKDVAGMCRSFDYLLRQAAGARGRAPEDPAPLVAAFLDGYRDAARGAAWWPAEPREESALLDAFVLDKALYELAYELDNRPDWVAVPLGALETLLTIFG